MSISKYRFNIVLNCIRMKRELLIFAVTAFFVVNTYFDGKYMALLKTYKKYYQMAGIAFVGLSAYLFMNKFPNDSRNLLQHTHGLIKYLPVDRDAGDLLTPIFDLTGNNLQQVQRQYMQEQKITQSGSAPTSKRCVSETKKKFVASQQGWICGDCQKQLPAWFEVDHKVRLDRGGNNHVSNLVALCRDCHGKKTAMENL